jgi:sigma-B regulation protein RsbU (phosphoserine phosphatase)
MPETVALPVIREQLVDRRVRLEREIVRRGATSDLARLLQDVDAALARVSDGTYGICETCHDTIEADRLLADPLARFCLDHLPAAEQRALERDLELAATIQRGLLPAEQVRADGWEAAYHYRPARLVSGDYCDVIPTPSGELYFMVGDVSGKGVAASMLMAHLHAMFRALVPARLPLATLMARASRLFCESTLPMHYATLVCGRASADGVVEICNAGHPPPIVVRPAGTERVDATGMPIGVFCTQHFEVSQLCLTPGEALVICTDGVIEAETIAGDVYGLDRLPALLAGRGAAGASELLRACVDDLASFLAGAATTDDVTVLALARR